MDLLPIYKNNNIYQRYDTAVDDVHNPIEFVKLLRSIIISESTLSISNRLNNFNQQSINDQVEYKYAIMFSPVNINSLSE